ncbi:hypothetical protein I7F13_11475 [Sinorhizobium meliloti]|uniref:Uncharacterized protein n=1 Tax=Rhizobium meliloti (strain 1021) TaxID=266834 RepID=Q92ZF2_RHIME|nr:hypothetical protein SMa0992 [Sinorhizobium meliloti 1021]AGG70217.1 Hypothetical protein SM2011_a0992 [Sinorhizobium meliloti 2011]ASP60387.1 hypothetical protein CDO30_18785 [Sinorhizobium meliloti]MCK3803132.1 hypothetical protein [Sinorhizobium meliloti]MCK3808906.1 hypothetical protein [Sinorhizobium meliloti]
MRSNAIRSLATPEQRRHRSRSHQAQRRHAEAVRCFASGRKAAVPSRSSPARRKAARCWRRPTIARALEQRLGSADPRSFKEELDRLRVKDTAAIDRINEVASLVDRTHRAELSRTYELTRSLKKGLGLSI